MEFGEMPPRDRALLAVAVLLVLGGVVALVAGWIAESTAIPLITVGFLVVLVTIASTLERSPSGNDHS